VSNSLALGRQSSGTIHAVWATSNALTFGYDIFRGVSSGGTTSWSSPPTLVSASAHEQRSPLAAHNNSRFLVAWVQPTPGGERVYAARVSGLGEFQDTNPIALSSGALQIVLSGVYSDGVDFRVLWHEKDVRTVGGGALLTTWTRRLGSVGDDGSAGTAFTCGPTSYQVSPIDIWIDSPRRYRVTLIDGDVIYNETIGASSCSGAGGFWPSRRASSTLARWSRRAPQCISSAAQVISSECVRPPTSSGAPR